MIKELLIKLEERNNLIEKVYILDREISQLIVKIKKIEENK